MQIWCLKCRASQEIPAEHVEKVTLKNGQRAFKSRCPTCNRKVMRMAPGPRVQ